MQYHEFRSLLAKGVNLSDGRRVLYTMKQFDECQVAIVITHYLARPEEGQLDSIHQLLQASAVETVTRAFMLYEMLTLTLGFVCLEED